MSALRHFPFDLEPPDRHDEQPPLKRNRWKRLLAWTAAAIVCLLLLLVIGVMVLLHSNKFHAYVLNTAQQKITESLGSNVTVQNYTLSFSGISPTLDIYGMVVHGAAPYVDPPVLEIDHVRAGVRVVSLIHQSWYLEDAEVHHPVVRVFVDKNGIDNLPKPKSSGQQSNTNIFDLAIRHAVLDSGEVYYNNKKSLLAADLKELTFHAGFDTTSKRYSGDISYRDGHLQVGNYNPIPHDLDAQFDVTAETLNLHQATMKSGHSTFVMNATIDDYAHPKVQAQYQAVLDVGEFRKILRNPSLPAGVLNANGTVTYAVEANKTMLASLNVKGEIGSKLLQLQTPSFRGAVRDLGAKYTLTNGNLDVKDIVAKVLGGRFNGNLTVQDLAGNSKSHLKATLKDVSVAEVKTLISSPALAKAKLNGTANLDADATWGKTIDDLQAKANATVNAKLGPEVGAITSNGKQETVPLNSVIHAKYSTPGQLITLTDSYLRTPKTVLNLNGTVSKHSALEVQMQSNDLHELEALADMFSAPTQGQAVQPLELHGTATFSGHVTGTTSAPELTGQLSAANLQIRGSSWRLLRTNVDLSPTMASLRGGELDPAKQGKISFDVRTALHDWSFTETSPFEVSFNASQLNVADLAKAAGSQLPVSGTLTANAQLHGTQLNPIGQGTLDLTQGKVSGETINVANVKFNGTGDTVHATLAVKIPAGSANGVLTYYPKRKGYEAQLHADGIKLEQIQAIKDRNMQLAGVLNIDASGKGTIDDPQLVATVQIPKLTVQNQTLSKLNLRADVANKLAKINLDSDVINSHVKGGGTIALSGNYDANLTLDTEKIPFAPLVAVYAPEQAGNVTGETELHATVRGPLKDKQRLEAHATIPLLNVNYKNQVQLGAPAPIHFDYVNGTLNLERAALKGTGTDLQFQGRIPIVDKTAPISLLLLGTVDLRLAQMVSPDITSSGQLKFNINSYGERSDPNVEGQIDVVNASFASEDTPLGLEKGNGVLTLTKDRLNISSFQGEVGGGTVTARGGILYRPNIQFDVAMQGRGIRLLYPEGVRTGIGATLTMTGSLDQAFLRGQVNVTQLSFSPDFDLMSTMGTLGGTSEPPPALGFSNNIQLQVNVRSTNEIDLSSKQLSLSGSANLNIRGTAAEPVVLGRINLNGGDLLFQGNRYVLQGGTVDFVNPSRTEPSMNIAVTTTIQQYNIAMHLEGPVDHMRTSYSSDPGLPPSDIINLVAFGKTSEASAANPSPSGALGAESLLASQVSGQVTSRVEKIAGISHLSIDPTLGGNQQNPGATVTIQQRVTSKIFVTFSTDVTATQNQTVQLEYKRSPRVSYSATRDQNGGFAIDTKIRKEW